MIIYRIINLINGKVYIGKDSNNKKSYYGSGVLLRKAIKKYGKKNFIKRTIEKCNSIKELNEKEIYWIKIYKDIFKSNCYNIGTGGEGSDNLKDHPDRERLLEEKKQYVRRGENHPYFGKKSPSSGIKWTEEQKDGLKESMKNSEAVKKAMASPERGAKISKAQKGVPKPKSSQKGEKNGMFGKHHSEESKQKTRNSISKSEKFKKAMASPERSGKISKAHKGTKKPGCSQKGEKNPMFGKTHTEENKKKMSFPLGKNPRAKKIIIIDKNNIIKNEFDTVTEASIFIAKSRTHTGHLAKYEMEIGNDLIIKYKN